MLSPSGRPTAEYVREPLPVLLAYDAVVATDRRSIPIDQFFTGYRQTALQSDELITAVLFPLSRHVGFRKVGTRAAQAISKVVMAGVRDDRPRIAIGSVAPTVLRVPRTEAALANGSMDDAVRTLAEEIQPIDDVRSTAEYRRTVTANLLRRFWADTSA